MPKGKFTSKKNVFTIIIGEEIIDPDMKAIYLIAEAMRISTPRMRKANLEFVLSSPKYNLKLK